MNLILLPDGFLQQEVTSLPAEDDRELALIFFRDVGVLIGGTHDI